MVGIVWGILPHLNKKGMRTEGLFNYTARRYSVAAIILVGCALVNLILTQSKAESKSIEPHSFPLSLVAGILSASSFGFYMWCLSVHDSPTVVTSTVYVLGLLFALIIGMYIHDEDLQMHHKIGIGTSILSCALLSL